MQIYYVLLQHVDIIQLTKRRRVCQKKEKKWTSDTLYYLHESQMHHANWKESHTQRVTLIRHSGFK